MIWVFAAGVAIYFLGFSVLVACIQSDLVILAILTGTLLMVGSYLSSLQQFTGYRMNAPDGLVRRRSIMMNSLFLVTAVVLFYALADKIMAL